ncbi:unnamed protein product, partial [marine sediment metagenome]
LSGMYIIDNSSLSGAFSIPANLTLILKAGQRYRVIIEGLSFETHGATKKSKPGKKGH